MNLFLNSNLNKTKNLSSKNNARERRIMEEYKKKTLESYNKNTDAFINKFKDLLRIHEREEFSIFIKLLKGKKILELGCGGGEHALYFKQRGLDVTCIDLSEEMIEECKRRGLAAEVMDIEELKFGKEEFDGIWAVTSLLHVPKNKLPDVLRKIHEILRGGGIFYICLKEGEGERMVGDKESDGKTQRFFAYWQGEEIKKLLEMNFEIIKEERVTIGKTVFLEYFLKK